MTRAGSSPAASMLLAACCLVVLLAGCSEKGRGVRDANLPPETFITYLPGEGSPNYYVTWVQWFGADPDGSVEAFEVVTIRDLTRELSEDLAYDNLPWTRTALNHGDFLLPADSCCTTRDELWYSTSLWGLLVRAIDNEGVKDPEPASRFFQVSNQVPQVWITAPDLPPEPASLPAQFYLEWEGDDADGLVGRMSYKYIVVLEADLLAAAKADPPDNPWPGLPAFDHDSTGVNHGAPPVGYWSEWVEADCTYVSDLDLSEYLDTGEYLYIFVTTMDEAGAVLPPGLFGALYNLNRNWIRFTVQTPGL
jgi:hypothetical protein